MDRRLFTKYALSGLGLAAIPSLLRGQDNNAPPGLAGTGAEAPRPLPVVAMAPPGPLPVPAMPGLPHQVTVIPLLDRAKAALDSHKGIFTLRDRVALADFAVQSAQHRFHIVDLVAGQSISYLVAHGRGSDPDHSGYLERFSNEPDSLATSEGAFRTGEIYDGDHGASMRLIGLDPTNTNAEMRAIVLHGAPYVSEDHIATWGKIGRSEGCFVVAPHLITQVLGLLGPGRLIYAAKV